MVDTNRTALSSRRRCCKPHFVATAARPAPRHPRKRRALGLVRAWFCVMNEISREPAQTVAECRIGKRRQNHIPGPAHWPTCMVLRAMCPLVEKRRVVNFKHKPTRAAPVASAEQARKWAIGTPARPSLAGRVFHCCRLPTTPPPPPSPPPPSLQWPSGLLVLAGGACQIGTARADLRLNLFIHLAIGTLAGFSFLFSCRTAGMGNLVNSGGRWVSVLRKHTPRCRFGSRPSETSHGANSGSISISLI